MAQYTLASQQSMNTTISTHEVASRFLAAQQRHMQAQYLMGTCFEFGKHVEQNYRTGCEFGKHVEQNYRTALAASSANMSNKTTAQLQNIIKRLQHKAIS
ncbi:10123_t:CDS:1 [Paraglomus occultum]|uniref:10123_t:CDS:1 n=1 Tax=Paraglomus occultum TaxID=144539 RepID=A0A9N9DGH4_9GLOM|nr:10123_t:CDS:1 [Paraglomus occultum]